MGLGLLGILGLGGVGAGIAGGLGYGFGIRYGFERIFPSFQQGGPQAAIKTAASDIATLLGTEGFDAGSAETDTFLGSVAGDDPNQDPTKFLPPGASDLVGPKEDPITTPPRGIPESKCVRIEARVLGLQRSIMANFERLGSAKQNAKGSARSRSIWNRKIAQLQTDIASETADMKNTISINKDCDFTALQ